MVRTIPWIVTVAAVLLLAPSGQRHVQGQQPAPIEFNQSLLDRWLAALPHIVKLGTSDSAPSTDAAARPPMEKICAEAGFDTYDQCAEVIGYVGLIVSACDKRSRTFRDPIVMMRQEIAHIEANKRLSPMEKGRATSELKQIVARFPDNIPQAHLQLMSANRDRVFAALAQSAN